MDEIITYNKDKRFNPYAMDRLERKIDELKSKLGDIP